MPTRRFKAEIEVDDERGVVYVHFANAEDVHNFNAMTAIRIKLGVDEQFPLDIVTKQGMMEYSGLKALAGV